MKIEEMVESHIRGMTQMLIAEIEICERDFRHSADAAAMYEKEAEELARRAVKLKSDMAALEAERSELLEERASVLTRCFTVLSEAELQRKHVSGMRGHLSKLRKFAVKARHCSPGHYTNPVDESSKQV